MNGTVLAASFSPDAFDCDGAAATATAALDAAGGTETAGTGIAATTLPVGGASFGRFAISILVKYRNPPTPIAAMQTIVTASGHIQAGEAVLDLAAGFLTCGLA